MIRKPFRKTAARAGCTVQGIIAVEFALTLLVLLPLAVATGEFLRLSLQDQTLARATHLAARAAGRDPRGCETAARDAVAGDRMALWLFDRDGDDSIGFVHRAGPDGSATQEVRIDITADDGDVSNGVTFDQPLCGNPGSMIQVRAVVPVRMPFLRSRIEREHTSWALNQT